MHVVFCSFDLFEKREAILHATKYQKFLIVRCLVPTDNFWLPIKMIPQRLHLLSLLILEDSKCQSVEL